MKTTICFLNDKIVVLRGKANRKKIKIKSIRSYNLPAGSLVNGNINDENSIKKVLEYYKSASFKLNKKINAIIYSSSVFVKKINVVRTSNKNLKKIVGNSYINSDNKSSDLLFDYCILDNNKKTNSDEILTFAVENSFIKSYMDIFKRANVKINKLDISTNCMIKLTRNSKKLSGRNYIVVSVNEPDISIYIFVNNKYFYSTKVKLFSSFYTENFYQEIASNISTTIQFNKSQNREIELNNVYVFGLIEDQIEKLKESVSDFKVDICSNDVFGGKKKYKKKANKEINCVYNIGALFGKWVRYV